MGSSKLINKKSENNKVTKQNNKNSNKNTLKKSLIDTLPFALGNMNTTSSNSNDNVGSLTNDDTLNLLQSDYLDLNQSNPSNKKSSDKNSNDNVSDDNTTKIDGSQNKNEHQNNATKNGLKNDDSKYLSPNKRQKKDKNIDEIINLLKNDYKEVHTLSERFNKYNFLSISDDKFNKLSDKFTNKLFEKFRSLNQIDKLIKSNSDIQETISYIFKSEDIASDASMYAYNSYCFFKLSQYKRNHFKHETYKNKMSTSSGDDDSGKSPFKFKKEQFDITKIIRDDEINSLNSRKISNLTKQDQSKLNTLEMERSVMEGQKSKLRMKNLIKSRNQYLTEQLKTSSTILNSNILNR